MSIDLHITYSIRCKECSVPLHAVPYLTSDRPGPITHFPTPVAALHRALEQRWTLLTSRILCPNCTRALDAHVKEY